MTAERHDGTTVERHDGVRGNAWLVDGEGDLWILHGADPAGTGMAIYSNGADDLLRALGIEDRFGIAERGPAVTIEEARQ